MWLNIILAKLNSSELASGLLPLQYVTYGAALGELQGSLCALLLVSRCMVNLLADRSRSIFAFLQIIADSCSLFSLPACWFVSSSWPVVFSHSSLGPTGHPTGNCRAPCVLFC